MISERGDEEAATLAAGCLMAAGLSHEAATAAIGTAKPDQFDTAAQGLYLADLEARLSAA